MLIDLANNTYTYRIQGDAELTMWVKGMVTDYVSQGDGDLM